MKNAIINYLNKKNINNDIVNQELLEKRIESYVRMNETFFIDYLLVDCDKDLEKALNGYIKLGDKNYLESVYYFMHFNDINQFYYLETFMKMRFKNIVRHHKVMNKDKVIDLYEDYIDGLNKIEDKSYLYSFIKTKEEIEEMIEKMPNYDKII